MLVFICFFGYFYFCIAGVFLHIFVFHEYTGRTHIGTRGCVRMGSTGYDGCILWGNKIVVPYPGREVILNEFFIRVFQELPG